MILIAGSIVSGRVTSRYSTLALILPKSPKCEVVWLVPVWLIEVPLIVSVTLEVLLWDSFALDRELRLLEPLALFWDLESLRAMAELIIFDC